MRRWVRPGSRLLLRRGTKRHARWRSTGSSADLERAIRDLSEAVWGRAWYPADVDMSRRHWGAYANNLGVALYDAYREFENPDTLNTAVVHLRDSVDALPEDSPARARALTNLIAAVETRLPLPRRGMDLPDLTELRRELSESTAAPT